MTFLLRSPQLDLDLIVYTLSPPPGDTRIGSSTSKYEYRIEILLGEVQYSKVKCGLFGGLVLIDVGR